MFQQDADSYSAFAQLTWNMSEEFRSTFGLRYTNDQKDASRVLAITDINGDPLAGAQAVLAPLVYAGGFNVRAHDLSGSREEDQLLPSIIVEWLPSDSTMLYASWSQGSKAGGYDARSNNPTAPPAIPCTSPGVPAGCTPANGIGTFEFEDEKATNLEFGAKLRLGGLFRIECRLLLTDFEDLQVSTFRRRARLQCQECRRGRDQGSRDRRALAGDAEPAAVRAASPTPTSSSTTTSGSAFFGQPSNAGDGFNCNYKGKTNEFVAPWVATLGANYTRPIGASLMMHLGLDVYYTDEYFVAPTLDPKQKQESYYKVNGRLGISDADGAWDVSLIGKNLLNEQILPYGNDTPLAGSTFGAFSAWRFVEPGSSLALQGTVRF